MPFVFSPKPLDGHMQAMDDGVRAAAEQYAPALERGLLAVWEGILREVRRFPNASDIAREFAEELRPYTGVLLLARVGGQQVMLGEILRTKIRKFSIGFVFDRLAPQTQG